VEVEPHVFHLLDLRLFQQRNQTLS
jgi:hypothetical protein